NDAAGHRWLLLAPQQTSFGTGSTPRANALWVLGASSNAQAGNGGWVAWPPPGWVPDTFLPESSHRWSLTRHDGAASLAGASVSATVGGTAASVRIVHRTADRLVWELDGPGLYTGLSEPIVSVTVAGISGGASSYSYDVRVLRAPFFNTTVFMSNELASGPATDKTGFYEPGLDLMSGDFDIDGRTDIAQRHGNRFELVSASGADLGSIGYGRAGDEVFIGDWNCDGVETFAVRRGNVFHVKNTIASGPADIVIGYGKPGDEVFVGDWDGNGCDTLAVRRGNVFFVRNSVTSGPADTIFGYGKAGDEVFVGDWNDDRRDTFAVHRGATFFLRDDLKSGAAQRIFDFGEPDDVVLVGDWDGDRIDTFAVAR
ncbi:MAG: hypothetical protein OEU32_08020, partial [Acidimicrobiia bacterium]|nr:hypothetical protein [Acidimicrobiia bacterium]